MELSLVNVPPKRVTSTLFSELPLCLLSLKIIFGMEKEFEKKNEYIYN